MTEIYAEITFIFGGLIYIPFFKLLCLWYDIQNDFLKEKLLHKGFTSWVDFRFGNKGMIVARIQETWYMEYWNMDN